MPDGGFVGAPPRCPCPGPVAGGLDAAFQAKILDTLSYYLAAPDARPRKRPKGPKMQGYDDMVRLAASLEHLAPPQKEDVGNTLIRRLERFGEGDYSWWAVGRLGTRIPFHGSAHNVVPPSVAERWLEAVLRVDWRASDNAPFAATMLARVSGDRQRDLGDEVRETVATRLTAHGAPESWVSMVREVTELGEADERRLFGESLPPGLELVE